MALPLLTNGQYIQKLYDIDSTDDWGLDIFIRPDSNFMIFGWSQKQISNKVFVFNMTVSTDGNTVLNSHYLSGDSSVYCVWPGNEGEVKRLANGQYISPITMQSPDITGSYLHSTSGIVKYNAAGDTIFIKTFTDTAAYFDVLNACAVMPDGGYILGGERGADTPSNYPGLLVRTDSMGDTLWTKKYIHDSLQPVRIINVIPLPDGRIIAAAQNETVADTGPPDYLTYIKYNPWFLLLDGMGNVLRDTVYATGYLRGDNCGELYKDMDGGYINIGNFDSLYTSDPSEPRNFPGYVAHLDSNFRITWITSFPYDSILSHRQPVMVRQLMDSSYIVIGDNPPLYKGWAIKISHEGMIVWNKFFGNDGLGGYLRGIAERTDGSIVFVGRGYAFPYWHKGDVWLLGVDSNGCEVEGCGITKVAPVNASHGIEVEIYPNPAITQMTISSNTKMASIVITNLLGQIVYEHLLNTEKAEIDVADLPSGMYLIRVNEPDGQVREVKKFMKE